MSERCVVRGWAEGERVGEYHVVGGGGTSRGGTHCVAVGPGRPAAGTGGLGCTGSALEERRGAANSGSDPGCGGYEDGSRQCASRDFTESAAARGRNGSGFFARAWQDRKRTPLNSSHSPNSYAVFCL